MADPPVLIDANVLVRYLLGEPREQAALWLFDEATRGSVRVRVHPAVLAEVVYVLSSPRIANLGRDEVADTLRSVLSLPGVDLDDAPQVLEALRMFAATQLDWVDCLLLSYLPEHDVLSFDRAMQTLPARAPGSAPDAR